MLKIKYVWRDWVYYIIFGLVFLYLLLFGFVKVNVVVLKILMEFYIIKGINIF